MPPTSGGVAYQHPPAMPACAGREKTPERGMSDALSALLHLSAHDYSWLAQFFSLLFLPFAHEDLAIILGAYVVVNDVMPVGLVALCIYGGMVASDFALYGIGSAALLSTIGCSISPTCSSAICSRSSRSAAWCPASSSLPLSPADGGACRSPTSPSQAWSCPRSICRSCSASWSSSATRSMVVLVGGRGRSCFVCWWRSDSSVDRFSTSSKRPSRPMAHGRSTSRCARSARWHRGIA